MIRRSFLSIFINGLLLSGCLLLTLWNLRQALPFSQWQSGFFHPDDQLISQMVFHYSLLPRVVMSLLVGGGLGLAGLLFQQVLRNPLAEPATLGVAGGAQLGITLATLLLLPGGEITRQLMAFAGALITGAIVFSIAWRRQLSPVTLILAGLILSLYCGAVNQLIALFNHDSLQSMFLWSTGVLNQQDWFNVQRLWPWAGAGFIMALLLVRPLTLLGLDEDVAKNLGARLQVFRFIALGLAIALSAILVSTAGIIGFIGLFAPVLTNLLGARRLISRMLMTPVMGALLLWFADQIALWLTDIWREIPTGTITALSGVPVLIALLSRLRPAGTPPGISATNKPFKERQRVGWWFLSALTVLLLLIVAGLAFGQDAQGWVWASGELWQQLLPWRAPRLLAALCAGMMLGVAGTLIQRLTANPVAGPEVLGVSSGAALGIVIALFFVPDNAAHWLLLAGASGAGVTLLVIILVSGRSNFSPERMLLTGVAMSTAFAALFTLLLASGHPRMAGLLTWIAGSTYRVELPMAIWTTLFAMVLLFFTLLTCRWLAILPLGDITARSLGMSLAPSRLILLLLAASLTAAATLIVGPLSFVGLIAPHITRMSGFRRAGPQLLMTAIVGGGLMVTADWAGRMVAFPDQIPAGLLATFFGAPYFIWLLRKSV